MGFWSMRVGSWVGERRVKVIPWECVDIGLDFVPWELLGKVSLQAVV